VTFAGRWLWWLAAAACWCVALAVTPDADGGEADPELRPGVESRVEAPRSGGHFIVYVPTDYAPTRRWPVIFCYHGQNGQPTAEPFKRVLGGKGFIIVGMEYLKRGVQRMTIAQMKEYMGQEAASFERAAAWVEQRLKVDKAMYFCGGFSKGGWTTSGLAEAIPRTWCGVAIMGAARQYFETPMDKPGALRGKPIYIGCGTKDPNFPHAEKSVRFYRKHGAKVTFEPYDGLGHSMKWDTETLPKWLYANGPQRDLKGRLAKARAAEKAGKLGRAYTVYQELAEAAGDNELGASAGELARKLGEQAEALLAAAEKAVAEKRYGDASLPLARLTSRFEGSPFAERADEIIRKLQSDPAIQAAVRQARLDAEADALEGRAREAEQKKDYATALRLYEQYAATCSGASRFREVKAHLDALKADKDIRAKVLSEKANRECRVWLQLADNYARAGKPAKAREYLNRIVASYADSEWGAKARERLAALDAAGN